MTIETTFIPVTTFGHGDLTGVTTTQHHTLYTDAEALAAVESSGLWTPNFADSSLSAGEGQTTSTAVGSFRRYGDMVYIWGKFDVSGLGTLTTTEGANIIGLPVASVTLANLVPTISFGESLGLAIGAGDSVVGVINSNTSHIQMRLWDATTGNTVLLISELTVGGSVTFSGAYRAA